MLFNKDLAKFEKLRGELEQIKTYCGSQYFAVEKCSGKDCKKTHVDRVYYPCIHFYKGNCKYGFNCHFAHSIQRNLAKQPPARETCKELYYNNYCDAGNKCKYSHDLREYPCIYNSLGNCKYAPDDCRFSHDVKKQIKCQIVFLFSLMDDCKN